MFNTYQATECFLRDYKCYKSSTQAGKLTKHNIAVLEQSLEQLSDDKYIDIIIMYYIEHHTLEYIAEHLYCDITTVYRQRKRLIRKLSILLFPDNVIQERFGGERRMTEYEINKIKDTIKAMDDEEIQAVKEALKEREAKRD